VFSCSDFQNFTIVSYLNLNLGVSFNVKAVLNDANGFSRKTHDRIIEWAIQHLCAILFINISYIQNRQKYFSHVANLWFDSIFK